MDTGGDGMTNDLDHQIICIKDLLHRRLGEEVEGG
jgi:hypothetical protein